MYKNWKFSLLQLPFGVQNYISSLAELLLIFISLFHSLYTYLAIRKRSKRIKKKPVKIWNYVYSPLTKIRWCMPVNIGEVFFSVGLSKHIYNWCRLFMIPFHTCLFCYVISANNQGLQFIPGKRRVNSMLLWGVNKLECSFLG